LVVFITFYKFSVTGVDSIGVWVLVDDNLMSVQIFDKTLENTITSVSIKFDKLPRFYVLCPEHCDHHVSTELFPKQFCLRTSRTANCKIANYTKYVLQVVWYVIDYINAKPIVIERESSNTLLDKVKERVYKSRNLESGSKTNELKPKVIYITKKKYYYHNRDEHATGSPKSPHNRRGHYRQCKSGKVVWVKESHIKGKQGNTYVIK